MFKGMAALASMLLCSDGVRMLKRRAQWKEERRSRWTADAAHTAVLRSNTNVVVEDIVTDLNHAKPHIDPASLAGEGSKELLSVYVIARPKELKEAKVQILASVGLDAKRISPVYLPEGTLDDSHGSLTLRERGLNLAHMNAMQSFLDGGEELGVVLEEDWSIGNQKEADVREAIHKIADKMRSGSYDMVRLGTFTASEWEPGRWGLTAYLVSKKGARIFYDFAKATPDRLIDWDMEEVCGPKMQCDQVIEPPTMPGLEGVGLFQQDRAHQDKSVQTHTSGNQNVQEAVTAPAIV